MSHLCCCSCFPQKTKPCRFITDISLANDLQCHGAAQIDIERFVSDAHCTATQLHRFPVFTCHQFVVVKSPVCLYWCRLDRILGSRRLARRNPASESLAEHAHRTEFAIPCSGKLCTANRASTYFPSR